jgi:hypothetical protein
MKVYVLLHNFDYAGSSLIDVYTNKATADAEAAAFNNKNYRGEDYSVEERDLIED